MISFISPQDIAIQVAERVKRRRLAENYSRKTLSEKSGVSEPSIKRFETSGEIAFVSLIKLAYTLDCLDEFEQVFPDKVRVSIKDVMQKPRARGRR